MLRTTLSKIRKVWALAFASRGSYDLKRTGPGKWQKISLFLNAEKSTQAGDGKDLQCQRCKELIERLFGPANTEHNISNIQGTEHQINYSEQNEGNVTHSRTLTPAAFSNDEDDPERTPSVEILHSTTDKQDEEKLAQKIEVIHETPLVEAQTERIDGFNIPPRVLNQLAVVNIVDDMNRGNGNKKNNSVNFASNNATQKNNSKGSSETDTKNSFDTIANVNTPSSGIKDHIIKDMKKLGVPHTTESDNSTIQVQMDVIKKRRPFKETEIDLESRKIELKPPNASNDEVFQLDSTTNMKSEYQHDLGKDLLINTKKEGTISESSIFSDRKTPVLAIAPKPDLSSVKEALNIVKKGLHAEENMKQSKERIILEIYIPPQNIHAYHNTEYLLPNIASSTNQEKALNLQQYSPSPNTLITPTLNENPMEMTPRSFSNEGQRFNEQVITDYVTLPDIKFIPKEENLETSVQPGVPVEQAFQFNQGQYFNDQAAEHYTTLPSTKEMSEESGMQLKPDSASPKETPTDNNAVNFPFGSNIYFNQGQYFNSQETTNYPTTSNVNETARDPNYTNANANYTENNSGSFPVEPVYYINQRQYLNEKAANNYFTSSNTDKAKTTFDPSTVTFQAMPADKNTAITLAETATNIDEKYGSACQAANFIYQSKENTDVDLIKENKEPQIKQPPINKLAYFTSEIPTSAEEAAKYYFLQGKSADNNSKIDIQTPTSKPASPSDRKPNPTGPTVTMFTLENDQNQQTTNAEVYKLCKDTFAGPDDQSFQDNEFLSVNVVPAALPELNPKDTELPLSELLRRVRLRSRLQTSPLRFWELYTARIKPQKELIDTEYPEQMVPVTKKCGTKKPPCPPPTPQCPPPTPQCPPINQPNTRKRKPPCPKPCTSTCPVSYELAKPTSPPPSPTCPPKDPCAKFTNISLESEFYINHLFILTRSLRKSSTLPIMDFRRAKDSFMKIILGHVKPQRMKSQSCSDLDQEYQEIHNFEERDSKLEDVALARSFDPWVPIPSWPPWPPKRPERKPMVFPQDGCKERPYPRQDPCAERGGPPCESFPKRRSFSLSDILTFSFDDLFCFPEP